MELEFVRHFELFPAETHESLPDNFRQMLSILPYRVLVQPLICCDYEKNKASFGQISQKFSLPKSTVYAILNDWRAKNRPSFRTETDC